MSARRAGHGSRRVACRSAGAGRWRKRKSRFPPLDAGAGIDPFLDALEGLEAPGLVPPEDAVRVNELLDQMGLALT